MNRLVTIMLCSLLTVYCSLTKAQDNGNLMNDNSNEPDVNVLYKGQGVGGIVATTEGWGIFYRKAKIISIWNKLFWEAEAVTMHSDKEYKVQSQAYPDATPYYFGKLNGMEAIRFGGGDQKMIWRKNDLSCAEVDAVFAGGLSLAVLKPVYLDIIQNNSDITNLVAEPYNPIQDNSSNIYGRASVFDGLNQLSFYPGLYGRFAINFDYANRHNTIKALETGVEIDAYSTVIPMMAYAKNNQVFANLYISVSIGKRWY